MNHRKHKRRLVGPSKLTLSFPEPDRDAAHNLAESLGVSVSEMFRTFVRDRQKSDRRVSFEVTSAEMTNLKKHCKAKGIENPDAFAKSATITALAV